MYFPDLQLFERDVSALPVPEADLELPEQPHAYQPRPDRRERPERSEEVVLDWKYSTGCLAASTTSSTIHRRSPRTTNALRTIFET